MLIAKDSGGGDFELAPQGNHLARCIMVCDLGEQERTYNGETKIVHQVRINFEIQETMSDGRPFVIGQNYTLSLSPKAILRKHLEGWRGRTFTTEELEGFDLFCVAGLPCMVQVLHNPSKDGLKNYANINSISSVPKGVEVPNAVNEIVTYSTAEHDQAVFDGLPEWLRDKINRPSVEMANVDGEPVASTDFEDDDIPF